MHKQSLFAQTSRDNTRKLRKVPSLVMNLQPSCCDATALTTEPLWSPEQQSSNIGIQDHRDWIALTQHCNKRLSERRSQMHQIQYYILILMPWSPSGDEISHCGRDIRATTCKAQNLELCWSFNSMPSVFTHSGCTACLLEEGEIILGPYLNDIKIIAITHR